MHRADVRHALIRSPCALVVVRAAPRAAGRDRARKAFVGGLAAPRDCGHFCHPRPMFRKNVDAVFQIADGIGPLLMAEGGSHVAQAREEQAIAVNRQHKPRTAAPVLIIVLRKRMADAFAETV